MVFIMNQCRKPSGAMGQRVLQAMNLRHSTVTDWGLGHTRIEPSFQILDVGCGGGRTVQKLAGLAPHGHVSGIDYSDASGISEWAEEDQEWYDVDEYVIEQVEKP